MQEDPKFGTDGVRGVANADLSAFFSFRLGRVAGGVVAGSSGPEGSRPRVLIGRDTRISGDMLRSALSAGLLSVGVDVVDLGVIPTPGVAFLTRSIRAAAGAVISASHNPAPDNGIKFFGPDGRKIADETETAIEEAIDDWERFPHPTGGEIGRASEGGELVASYLEFLKSCAPGSLRGLRIVMDCGNGAASLLGPRLARELGAEVISLFDSPDGLNINDGCGALHPEKAQQAVREHGADFGVSFDGDADRAIFTDGDGNLVDGDRVMAMCAIDARGTDGLPGNVVVGTVMSNVGLERGLAEHGIRLERAPVGDRHVAERMRAEGAALGGEKSGHIIFSRLHTTGDGLLTFLQVAGLVHRTGRSLAELAGQIREYPQLLVNVPVWRRRGWRDQPDLWAAVREAEARLGNRGRVLVRASGTERIIRVMAEGPEEGEVHEIVERICAVVRDKMGSPPPGASDEDDDE
ncbi:MAG: phosphoglucosamine mutase [Armatimonadota bacterium]